MSTTQLLGQHRHYLVTVENGWLSFRVFFRGVELKRVAIKVHAGGFYNWLGKELGVQRCDTTSSEKSATQQAPHSISKEPQSTIALDDTDTT